MQQPTINFETLRKNCPSWQDYINHSFIKQLGDGRLDKSCFLHYLQQDYLFLIQFTRAWALAVYKSNSFEQMRAGQAGINTMLDTEISLHIDYCRRWGVSEASLKAIPESSACIAYTRYVLDCGMSGSLAELYAALAPCVLGYAEIGRLLSSPKKNSTTDNPYQSWIDLYASEDFQTAAQQTADCLNQLCRKVSSGQAQRLQHIFDTATRMEVAFWQMGLGLS